MSALLDLLTEGRCLADITLRDEEHRQAVCILAKGHDTVHDDGMGTTWTDKDHWRLREVEALRATVARVEAVADEWSDPGKPIGIIGLPWAMTIREALRGDES